MYSPFASQYDRTLSFKIGFSEEQKKEREEFLSRLASEFGDYSDSSDDHSSEGGDKKNSEVLYEVRARNDKMVNNSKKLSEAITIFKYDINSKNIANIKRK